MSWAMLSLASRSRSLLFMLLLASNRNTTALDVPGGRFAAAARVCTHGISIKQTKTKEYKREHFLFTAVSSP